MCLPSERKTSFSRFSPLRTRCWTSFMCLATNAFTAAEVVLFSTCEAYVAYCAGSVRRKLRTELTPLVPVGCGTTKFFSVGSILIAWHSWQLFANVIGCMYAPVLSGLWHCWQVSAEPSGLRTC